MKRLAASRGQGKGQGMNQGGPLKIDEMLKKAREMQQRVEAARESMKTLRATGESGGGIVKVTLNGHYEALRVDIEPAALEEDRQMLQDLIAAAINDATRRVAELQEEHMGAVAKQIGLPNLPGGIKLPM